jgi:Lrp/AsnC family transcriptional regulator, leucine-responsive regulatory protein
MDRYDREILAVLQKNARVTPSEISQRIHLSVPAVSERVRKLEQHGYIRGFTTLLFPDKFGKNLAAFVAVTLEHPRYVAGFLQQVRSISDILECHHVAGDEDYWLKVVTENTASMEALLTRLKQIEGLRRTKTTIVLSTVKEEPGISVPEE